MAAPSSWVGSPEPTPNTAPVPALRGPELLGYLWPWGCCKSLTAFLPLCISVGEFVRASAANPQCTTAHFCTLGAILQLSPFLDEAPGELQGACQATSKSSRWLVPARENTAASQVGKGGRIPVCQPGGEHARLVKINVLINQYGSPCNLF